MSKEKIDIVVIGSSNTDMVIQTKQLPRAGETVLGGEFFMNQGGKGANQAVAAARLGGKVSFAGRVGKDLFGNQAISNLLTENVAIEHVKQDLEVPSGIATITVDETGQNSIVVSPGANAKLCPEDINDVQRSMENAAVILIQLEISLDTVEYVVKKGHKMGKKVILNPAPYGALKDEILTFLYAITPNQTEAESLTGVKVLDQITAKKAALILQKRGVKVVVITMGEAGAFVLSEEYTGLLPVPKVKAVDTTAAGDCFNGAFALAIAQNMSLKEAVIFSNKAAAISVTKKGAQASCPTLNDLKEVPIKKELF